MSPKSSTRAPDTDGGAYEILHLLGEGATGKVFAAVERETGERLAIKQLTRLDHKSVLRLKREFRSLADLHHPNLVKLYDLRHGSAGWFLVMELIAGQDLGSYLASPNDSHDSHEQLANAAAEHQRERIYTIAGVFHQLALGVQALHQAGLLHRDLKPSNVLVAEDRVVVLDFGLVRELATNAVMVTQEGAIAGTPAYMAPEQATASTLSEATDWYALGVMLYEVLCGRLPIEARQAFDMLRLKNDTEPAPLPAQLELPESLRALCMALLQREPAQRPSGGEIIACLRALQGSLQASPVSHELDYITVQAPTVALVGRTNELTQLSAALERGRRHGAVVHLRGQSGSGKSALIERFLQTLAGDPDVFVLRSRCYEREAMPFKALDGLIDALTRHLASMDELKAAHAMPSEIAELTQLFPMLDRVEVVRRLLAGRRPVGDAAHLRQRAERGLRGLIEGLGKYHLPVIVIDDLHWGDLDSASVLRDWLQDAIVPSLLILSYRSAELATSPCLRVLAERARPLPPSAARELVLELAPLSDSEVEALCQQRHGAPEALPDAVVTHIVQEARGNPFLAQQLTALARVKLENGTGDAGTLSLSELVTRSSALLPRTARTLLDVLAIAGRPLSPRVALPAAGMHQQRRAQIHALQGLHLLRTRNVAGERLLEVYHDRVREVMIDALTAGERAQLEHALLREMELVGGGDPAWLYGLALGAGDTTKALRYCRVAAEQANASLAFERAAELYTKCLALTHDSRDAGELWTRLALASARCRRGVQAAEAYLQASQHVSPERSVPLLRLAASHFLRSGRFTEGEVLVRRVLAALKLDVPERRSALLAAVAWELTRLTLRGDHFEPRPKDEVSRELIDRSEVYLMLSVETMHYAPLRAVLFQARALRSSYEAREPVLYARNLALSATLSCVSGTASAARRSQIMVETAAKWAARYGDRNIELEVLAARAICAMLLGRPNDVLEPAYETERISEQQNGVGDQGEYYYMFAVRAVRIGALQNLGRYRIAIPELADALAKAQATDNRTAILLLTLPVTLAEQAVDQCASSRVRLERERTQLPDSDFGIIHLQHLLSVLRAACMTEDRTWAQPVIDAYWPTYLRSPVRRGAYMAYVAFTSHARLLLNEYAASRVGDPARALRADLSALAALPHTPCCSASIIRHKARLAFFAQDKVAAIAGLRQSSQQFTSAGFVDDGARDSYGLGLLLGGSEGAQLIAASQARLRELGFADPEAELRGYYPELIALAHRSGRALQIAGGSESIDSKP